MSGVSDMRERVGDNLDKVLVAALALFLGFYLWRSYTNYQSWSLELRADAAAGERIAEAAEESAIVVPPRDPSQASEKVFNAWQRLPPVKSFELNMFNY